MFKHLWSNNPMRAEVQMANARFVGGRNWAPAQVAAGAICGILYLFFLWTVMNNSQHVDFRALLVTMLVIALLILPIVMHGVVAGEKEKRSLEMLLAAPVTSSQIAFAKLMRGAIFFLVVIVAFLIPLIIILAVQASHGEILGAESIGHALGLVLLSLILIALAALANGSISLAVSAMCRSTSAAMLSCVGTHFLLLVFPWVLLGPLMAEDRGGKIISGILTAHPVGAVLQLLDMWEGSKVSSLAVIFTVPVILWSLITICCFQYVVSNLDAERRLGGRSRKGVAPS